jgi:hypothetical protein
MKKYILGMLIACAFAAGMVLFVVHQVFAQKEDVTITQEVIYGDPTAAKGIDFTIRAEMNGNYLWETTHEIDNHKTTTDMTFRKIPTKSVWYIQDTISLRVCADTSWQVNALSDTGLLPADTALPEVFDDVASRTKPGHTHTEIIRLADYYTYYPLSLSGGVNYGYMIPYVEGDLWSSIFRIPVAEDELYEVTVGKSDKGVCIQFSVKHYQGGNQVISLSDLGDEDAYLTYYLQSWDGERLIDEEPYALYQILPMPSTWVGELKPSDVDRYVQKVFEFEDGVVPLGIQRNQAGDLLYVLVDDAGEYKLRIYHPDGRKTELLDEVLVRNHPRFAAFERFEICEDGVLLVWDNNTFAFVEETAEKTFRLFLCAQYPEAVPFSGRISDDLEFVFDKERLVIATFHKGRSLDVDMAVFDPYGLLYHGIYRNSLQDERMHTVYGNWPASWSDQMSFRQNMVPALELRIRSNASNE